MKKMSKEEHKKHLKKMFGEDYVEKNLKSGMEAALRRELKQLLDMVNDVESLVFDCIEAEVDVGKIDQILHSAENTIKEACEEVGITMEEMNEHRYEYFDVDE
jgi:hypothetical protein